MEDMRTERVTIRMTEDERKALKRVAFLLDRDESGTIRFAIEQFGRALGVIPGKPSIEVEVKRVEVGELEY